MAARDGACRSLALEQRGKPLARSIDQPCGGRPRAIGDEEMHERMLTDGEPAATFQADPGATERLSQLGERSWWIAELYGEVLTMHEHTLRAVDCDLPRSIGAYTNGTTPAGPRSRRAFNDRGCRGE